MLSNQQKHASYQQQMLTEFQNTNVAAQQLRCLITVDRCKAKLAS